MKKPLMLAMKEVKKLPAEMQERFGYEIIDRVAEWHALREKIAAGARELDAGLGRPLNVRDVIHRARARYGKKKK